MTPEEIGLLQQQLYAVQAENAALRAELQRLAAQQQASAERRQAVIRGGSRLLVPLLDRQKVVRSFGKLVETTGGFTGAREQWPSREQVLGDARVFLESLVRFAIRRRMFFLLLGLLGAVIPAIQIYLVVQQNEIIDKQTTLIEEQLEHSEIQMYDVVARSMTEGDRNAKLMTGALLSRSDPAFLAGVIEEVFNPELQGVYYGEGVDASTRRLEDTAFKGPLARAAVRGVHRRLVEQGDAAVERWLPSLRFVVVDAKDRVPMVLRLGRAGQGNQELDGALGEAIDEYLVQVGLAMRLYARLARASGREAELYADLRLLLRRVEWDQLANNRFAKAQQRAMRELLVELAVAPGLRDELLVGPSGAGLTDQEAHAKGIEILREGVGADALNWKALSQQVGS